MLAEAEGILAWAVEGALKWHQHGLPALPEVEQVTNKWRHDADQIGRFIEAHCITVNNAEARASALYGAYKAWAETSGERVEAEKNFSERLQDRGFEKKRTPRGVLYLGIGLSTEQKE